MLLILSPSKTLDFGSLPKARLHSKPALLSDSRKLVKRLREFSVEGLEQVMNISEKLARENHDRYRRWKTPFTAENARQAILAFQGEVFVGLDATSYTAADFRFAQKSLRILSGLYGVLRPMDLIQAYRLEMGTRLQTDRGDDLYEFWGDKITKQLNAALAEQKPSVLINLASNEYFKAVIPGKLRARVITPVFKEERGGRYRAITLFLKNARGQMATYAIRNRLRDVESLKGFDIDGYRYNDNLSSEDQWVFTRRSEKV
jgi:cytoplasmic iron level regulating protein YaaA (DUF328/UPF0246 family)